MQPPAYSRTFSFTDFAAAEPTTPPPGASIDAEYDAVALTIAAIRANLALIQRDDGALKNALVTLDSLSTEVIATLGAGSHWTPRGAWVTTTAYVASDVVQSGTKSLVCAVAHTAGVLVNDIAAGRWIVLFDSDGTVPGDGTVTEAKLADGSVTEAKIGFTALDLSGAIRGQGGIAAGTAALGSLLHAKSAAGAAYGKIERTTDAQGAVGYQIIGVGATWTLEQAVSSNNLQLRVGSTVTVTYPAGGGIDVPGTVRAVTGAVPTTGNGIGITFVSNIGYLKGYDYDASVWRDLKVQGKDVYVTAGGVDVVKVTSTGVEIAGDLLLNGSAIGNPTGSVIQMAVSTAPAGYLKCDGSAVSRTTYAALFAVIGIVWGPGNGTTTFNLPDLRGEFVRGWSDARLVDTGRAFASAQADELKAHTHTFPVKSNDTNGGSLADGTTDTTTSGTVTTASTGGTETRPRNVALLYCIKT